MERLNLFIEDPEFLDVRQFHQKLGFPHGAGRLPRILTPQQAVERANFMLEELLEFAEAAGVKLVTDYGAPHFIEETRDHEVDLALQADALVDLVYVAKGTADLLALPWKRLWDDVQRANMLKVPGKTHRGVALDAAKPPGWVGPKTAEILRSVGTSG